MDEAKVMTFQEEGRDYAEIPNVENIKTTIKNERGKGALKITFINYDMAVATFQMRKYVEQDEDVHVLLNPRSKVFADEVHFVPRVEPMWIRMWNLDVHAARNLESEKKPWIKKAKKMKGRPNRAQRPLRPLQIDTGYTIKFIGKSKDGQDIFVRVDDRTGAMQLVSPPIPPLASADGTE